MAAMVTYRNVRGPAFGWLFIGIGVLVFLVLGVVAIVNVVIQQEQSSWPQTSAVVVDHEKRTQTRQRRDNDGRSRTTTSTTWAAVYEYTVDGRQYRNAPSFSSSNPPAVGSTMTIAYDPSDPNNITVPGETTWLPWMLGGMAVLFLLAFGGAGVAIRRAGQRQVAPPGPPSPPAPSGGFAPYQPGQSGGVADGNPFTPDDRR